VDETPPVPSGAWFNPIAHFLGKTYWAPDTGRVMAFTKGTEQEVDFLVDALALQPGMRVLDAGCGPGRHSLALARRGFDVVGVDLSPDFIALARDNATAEHLSATFDIADIRDLMYEDEFDAVICLCQGGFGLLGGKDDEIVIGRFAAAAKPATGRVAVSAFSSYFVVKHQEPHDTFDAATGVNHELATLRDENGKEQQFDLWTTCFTPRELRLVAERAGLVVDAVYGVTPGAYGRHPPSLDVPEHLLLAHRP
jgi:SAM-dependent methyltransferase